MFLTIRTRIRNNCPFFLLFKRYFLSLRTWNHFPWFSPLHVGVGVRVGRRVLHIMPGSQEVRNTHLCAKERGDWMARWEMGYSSLVEMINYAQFCTCICTPLNITYANTSLIAWLVCQCWMLTVNNFYFFVVFGKLQYGTCWQTVAVSWI